jgi:hypothetical protein
MELHNFPHGINYYGSYLGIKNNFTIDVADDIEFLHNSSFFNKNKNVLFTVEDYKEDDSSSSVKNSAKPLLNISQIEELDNIDENIECIDNISKELFEDIFEDITETSSESFIDLVDLTNENILKLNQTQNTDKNISLKSNSTCSSRTSYTDYEDELNKELHSKIDNLELEENSDSDTETINTENDCNCDTCKCDSCKCDSCKCDTCKCDTCKCDTCKCDSCNCDSCKCKVDCEDVDNKDGSKDGSEEDGNEEEDSEDSSEESEYESIGLSIPKFPTQIICMEYFEDIFDNLILSKKLTNEEWFSALFQIIMILNTYQKVFQMTHNDLHTNNVMYNKTNKKFLYYCYNKKYYKVPTFGRIYKIIDFGRGIYKFDGKIFCSDSFQTGGDAATQYNIEPYFNENKPRLEPNYSFDLCRLACSIFDYVVDDIKDVKDLSKCTDPVQKLIVEWCLDDKGLNVLYKNNGDDRYPDFKLYKMIARCVHNHTPQVQLLRPEFDKYNIAFTKLSKGESYDIINIDEMNILV